jgi:hypothetical protein
MPLTHAEIIDRLGTKHEAKLQDALVKLEARIAAVLTKAPTKDGALFDLEWAIKARPIIAAALRDEYLAPTHKIISDYDKAVESAQAMIGKYAAIADVPPDIIRNLKNLSFTQFETLGTRFADTIASELYQNTLTGRPVTESIDALRHKINGVFIESDSAEANDLVEIAKNTTGAEQQEAVDKLHSIYARNKVGDNLRRHSTQMIHDSLMQFDASIVTTIGKESGATKWEYYGSIAKDSREWCKEHAGNIYTEDEIREEWESNDWEGKEDGDPFIVRGGYNCRHHWRPVFDE